MIAFIGGLASYPVEGLTVIFTMQKKIIREYEKFCCIYCGKFTVRKKRKEDFKKGEKVARGYFPESQVYYYCEFCYKTMLETL